MKTEITKNASPYGMTLRHTLRGQHEENIWQIAWSPDGTTLASGSCDRMLCLWNPQTGQHLRNLVGHVYWVMGVAWSPNGTILASGSSEHDIRLWDPYTGKSIRTLSGHAGDIYSVAWSPNGTLLASGSYDNTIRIWDPNAGRSMQTLIGPGRRKSSTVESVAWSPDGVILASGSYNAPICLWDLRIGQVVQQIGKYNAQTSRVVWSATGVLFAADSRDKTIKLWDPYSGQHLGTLEGHTETITDLAFNCDGRLLASRSVDGEVRIWRTDTWDLVAMLEKMVTQRQFNPRWFGGLAFHPTSQTLARATVDEDEVIIQIWDLDVDVLLRRVPVIPSIHYTNAKVVLVGDSGVGKSGLRLVLSHQDFVPTESTHGRVVETFSRQESKLPDGRKEVRETLLWDLAGQPGYRLVHQLHLSEVTVALVVFDAHSETDPFAGISHWVRALRTAQRVRRNMAAMKMLLVLARIDRSGKRVSRARIDEIVQRLGFDDYFETSAKESINIAALVGAIEKAIDWEQLPKVTSTELFQRIRTFLIAEKQAERLLSTADDLYRAFLRTWSPWGEKKDLFAEFATGIRLLESTDLIRQLSFGNLVLLQPELLDTYASALVNAVRDEPDGLGSISEEDVHTAAFPIPKSERIAHPEQEKLLLIAMVKDLLFYEIALREQGEDGPYLVFPSESTRENPALPDPENASVVFTFEGPALNIYATLAVRLSQSGLFSKKDLWKNAVIYDARVGGTCGIWLKVIEDGKGELTLFFDEHASKETRFHFEEYVRVHLQRKALPESITSRRIHRCDCGFVASDQLVRMRTGRGLNWFKCPNCDKRVDMRDHGERLRSVSPSRVSEMDRAADIQRTLATAQSTVHGKQETNDFDVFLCYNETDRAAIINLGERLKDQGLLPWLDVWELRPGLPWQRVLESQIGQIKSAAIFVGQDGIGPWEQMELEAFLREFVQRKCPVIPVILANAPKEPQLPVFLRGMTWVDFRKQDPDPMNQLSWGITGKRRPLR